VRRTAFHVHASPQLGHSDEVRWHVTRTIWEQGLSTHSSTVAEGYTQLSGARTPRAALAAVLLDVVEALAVE
jgi:hypothetical protein